MIRAGYNLFVLVVKLVCGLVLFLAVFGVLPWPLVAWLGMELVRGVWGFLNLPPFVQGVGVALVVYVLLARWFHNAPLKAQRAKAIQRAEADYLAQKW